MHTSVKHKAIYTDLFIPSDADPLYQLLLVANGGYCGHEPAIAVGALSNIVGGRAFYEELGVFEDILLAT